MTFLKITWNENSRDEQCVHVESEAGMLHGKKTTVVRIFGYWCRNFTVLWNNFGSACGLCKSLWFCSLKCTSTWTGFYVFYITFRLKSSSRNSTSYFFFSTFFNMHTCNQVLFLLQSWTVVTFSYWRWKKITYCKEFEYYEVRKPTRCYTIVYWACNSPNMFRALLCSSSGAWDYTDIHSMWHITVILVGCRWGVWL